MSTTFDRYLFGRYVYSYFILFVCTFGLFVVIDGFTNVDGFQEGRDSASKVLEEMAAYYMYQSSLFFDLVASILSVIAIMIVFALLQRHGELHPILAAGVPTYRLALPVVVGVTIVNAAIVINQEFVIPRISHHLQASRSGKDEGSKEVEPVYDYATHIHIGGRELILADRKMREAKFVLRAPELAYEITILKAEEAIFYREGKERPAGWHLKNVTPSFDELSLTPDGRKIVRQLKDSPDIYVVTDVSFDHLYNRARNYRYVSTPELIRRIRNPAFGIVSVRGQSIHLHTRLLRPIINIIAVYLTIPLVVRKESRSLIADMAVCCLVMSTIYGFAQFLTYLAHVNLVAADLSAWAPAIASGALCAWLAPATQT